MKPQLTLDETHDYYLTHRASRRFVLLSICLGSMLGPFALASVNLALPTIALELNADAVIVSWMPTGFLLSSVMCMLPIGKLSDRYGRKRFYFWGVLATGLFSLLASVGPSMEWLLICRILQGISMSMVFGSGMAILSSIYPASERGSAIGLYAASVYIALTISPAIGGWMTELLSWRSVFWIQAPPAVVVTLMLFKVKGEWKDPVAKPFDWTGSIIFAFWAGTLVYGLSGLPRPSSVITLVLSFAYFWLFIFHQNRIEHPLIRPGMFRENRMFSFSLLAALLAYGATYPMAFLLSLFLQIALGYSPISAANILLLQAMITAFIAPFSGRLSDRFDAGRMATLGCVLMTLGFIQLSFVSTGPRSAEVITVGLVLLGVGFGLFSTPNMNAAMSEISESDIGVASASVNLARTMGNMLGMSLVSLLIYNLIGANEFASDQTDELTSTLRIWVYASIVFTLFSATLSFFRGKMKRIPPDTRIENTTASNCDDLAI